MSEDLKILTARYPGFPQTPVKVEWRAKPDPETPSLLYNLYVECTSHPEGAVQVGWIMRRPSYCDRGQFSFNAELPLVDGADSFPRYYMREECMRHEVDAWFKWRLWQIKPNKIGEKDDYNAAGEEKGKGQGEVPEIEEGEKGQA